MRPSSSSMARIFPSPHIVLQDMGREVQDRYTRVRGGGGPQVRGERPLFTTSVSNDFPINCLQILRIRIQTDSYDNKTRLFDFCRVQAQQFNFKLCF